MLISADQIRAARALRGWNQTELADRTGLAVPTIANIELGKQSPGAKTIERIVDAFALENIEFTQNEGVSWTVGAVVALSEKKGYERFYDLIYGAAKSVGSAIYSSNFDARFFAQLVDDKFLQIHADRMGDISHKINYKILVKEGESYFPEEEYASYRWVDERQFTNVPFFVFDDYVAILLMASVPTIAVMNDKKLSDQYRKKFLLQWKAAKQPIISKSRKTN